MKEFPCWPPFAFAFLLPELCSGEGPGAGSRKGGSAKDAPRRFIFISLSFQLVAELQHGGNTAVDWSMSMFQFRSCGPGEG
uniref:Putative secreted protein n=1 Tax=Anopheles marajoara TaxID=58244 RepID=A0A2M4CBN6_9DIPT